MPTHFEESLQRDIERIRDKVTAMAALNERALRDCVKALQEKNRQLAYAVILRDHQIDEMEEEIDQLCLEFLVRQQPVGGPLRFAYATIRINLELERVGDYAESVGRQVLKLSSMDVPVPFDRYLEIANHSIPMLRDAVKSFVEQDAEFARKTMEVEKKVDVLKSRLNADLMNLSRESKIAFEALNALMMISRHFERVSDEAKNICTEVLYMCTGEYSRHQGAETTRLLFVDVHNSCRSQMAEAIANSLPHPMFVFSSAGLEPTVIDPATITFLQDKGLDVSSQSSKAVTQIRDFGQYQIIVALAKEAEKVFPRPPTKTVCLDWSVNDPSKVRGSPAEVRLAYDQTFQFLHAHITDLVQAVIGVN